MRDVRSHERAQREHGLAGDLERRLGRAVHDPDQRPRPVLGGWTAGEVFHDVDQVRRDRQSLDELEQETRGITEVRHDWSGAIVLDSPEDDIDALTAATRQELEKLGN